MAFVRRERVEAAGRVEGFWPGAPDLAFEVVSPSDTHAAVTGKAVAWLEAGCRMVLVADPEQDAVSVYRSRAAFGYDSVRPYDATTGEMLVKLPTAAPPS